MSGKTTYADVIEHARYIQQRARQHKAEGKAFFYAPAPGLGWDIAPDTTHTSLGSTSDELGFRKSSAPGTAFPDGLPRISFWGDSICEGCEVADEDTWLWLLQQRLAGDVRIFNGGVSAYGTDQALLRFQARQPEIKSDIAFLCYPTADLERNVNIQRMFLMQPCDLLFLKPRFLPEGDGLRLLAPPDMDFENMVEVLERSSTHDHLKAHDPFYPSPQPAGLVPWLQKRYRHFFGISNHRSAWNDIRAEALEVTARIFERFLDHCSDIGVQGVILFLPILTGRNASGDDFDILQDRLQKGDRPFIDLRPAFGDIPETEYDKYFMPKNHYTRASGERIAKALEPEIRALLGSSEA